MTTELIKTTTTTTDREFILDYNELKALFVSGGVTPPTGINFRISIVRENGTKVFGGELRPQDNVSIQYQFPTVTNT